MSKIILKISKNDLFNFMCLTSHMVYVLGYNKIFKLNSINENFYFIDIEEQHKNEIMHELLKLKLLNVYKFECIEEI